MKNEMMLENYCDDCDEVLNVVVDTKKFYDFKVGRIRCKCGHITMPCNECLDDYGQHFDCSHCPWKKAKIVDVMSDMDYMLWVKKNEPKMYKRYLDGKMGDYYNEIIKEIEKESVSKRVVKSKNTKKTKVVGKRSTKAKVA